MSTPWDRLVIPHLDSLVGVMRPRYFLDILRARDLINGEEYGDLRAKTTAEQVRQLISELLPPKPNSYERFRQVLRDTKEQKHLLDQYFLPDDQPVTTDCPFPIPCSQDLTPNFSMSKDCTTDAQPVLPVQPSPLPSSQHSTPVPPSSNNRECTTDDIRLIYLKISPYWHKIGVALKLPKYELDKIKSEESKDDERCYSMLNKWLNKNFGKATIFTLFDAIRDVQCPLDAIKDCEFNASLIEGWIHSPGHKTST